MSGARTTGRWGEELTAEYLAKRGYRIIAMDYTTRLGELDVIAENGEYIAFVEVKTRKDASVAEAREFVGPAKRRKCIAAAALWLRDHETELQPRFDVVEIYASKGAKTERPIINYIENAFGL